MATWTIANLERNTADGGVTIAHWRVTEVDGDYSASSYGTCGFTPDASADGFIAFDSLTEETVIGWVKDALDVETIEQSLVDKIEADKNPVSTAGLPW